MDFFIQFLVGFISAFAAITCVLVYFAFKRGWQGWGGYE